MKPLEYMRRYGAFEVATNVGPIYEQKVPEAELEDPAEDPYGRVYTHRGIPITLLTLALVWRDPIAQALGITRPAGERLVYTYSSVFPHWMLNAFFGFFTLLALIAICPPP